MKAKIGTNSNSNAAMNLNVYASSSAKSILSKSKARNGTSINDNGVSLVNSLKNDIDEANSRDAASFDLDQSIPIDELPPPPLSTPPIGNVKSLSLSPNLFKNSPHLSDETRKRADSGRELLLHALGDADIPPPPPPPMDGEDDIPPPPPPPPSFGIEKSNQPKVIYPIANSYINDAIANSNPFEGRNVEALSPEQISVIVDNSLYSPKSIAKGAATIGNLRVGDIVIVGAGLRTGAAAISKFIDGLLHQDVYLLKSTTLVQRCRWIESKVSDMDIDMDPSFAPATISNPNAPDGHRLFLSFFSSATFNSFLFSKIKKPSVLKPLNGALPIPSSGDMPKFPKFIVCVRNPVDVHLSYFRFIRRMYRQVQRGVNNSKNFDDFFVADDFSRIDLPPVFAQSAGRGIAVDQHLDTYEHNIAKWIELYCQYPESIQFVFYEDLVVKPQIVMNDIIQFLNLNVIVGQKEAIIEKSSATKKSSKFLELFTPR